MKNRTIYPLISLLIFLLISLNCFAQKSVTVSSIKNAGNIKLTPAIEWQRVYTAAKINEPVQVVMKFTRQLSGSDWQTINRSIQVISYLPDNVLTGYFINSLDNALIPYTYIADIKPEWKADQFIWNKTLSNGKSLDIVIKIDKSLSLDVLQNKLQLYGAKLIQNEPHYNYNYAITIPANRLKDLAAWQAVEYISPLSTDEPLDVESQYSAKINIVSSPIIYGGFGLTGKGVTVGVGDNVSGNFHIDLKDRIINYNPVSYSNHGVHINGIVGGAGIIDFKGTGAAPGATLINHLYSNVWDQLPAMYQTHNVTLTNNSYASVVGDCNYAGTYDMYSQALDQQALDYPDVLQIFAAGNDGYLNCSPYPQGFATVNGGFQPAKNTIVVTSTNKKFVNATDGSRGPVKDGRLKPEMTAVGVDVNSTTRSEEYLVAGGTSMACPEVTGALALLTERYKQLHGNTNPANDLLKCLILNGTTDIGNPGPDYRFGFGFLNLYRSLLMLNNNQYVSNSIQNGQEITENISVPANIAQLKVMLCWNDQPASPMSTAQLINDLDIEVTTPASETHLPLILDPAPANILNNAVEGIDRRNNCEQIIIDNPALGNYTVKVKGYNIPTGQQRYVLSYDIIPTGVMLGFPNTGAQVKANDSVHIYWDASNDGNSFTLEYSTDGGNQWSLIDNNIPSYQRYYVWYVADGINSGKCLMRLTRNNTLQVFTTGNFIINQQPIVQLDTVQCPGYMRIKWQSIPSATGYQVMRKLGPEMHAIDTVINTEYTLTGLSFDSIYYMAVRPLIDGIEGYRSIAVRRHPNDGNCSGDISNGDMRADAILSSNGGRKFTTTELTNTEEVLLQVQNLDNAPVNHYKVSYRINNSSWQSFVSNTPIPALGKQSFRLSSFDMSATGDYTIQAAITNLLLPDPVPTNDTLIKTTRQLNNDPITLAAPFADGFEEMGIVATGKDTIGFTPNQHWDYYNDSDSGRLRSFVNTGLTLNGNRSISLDAVMNTVRTQNELIGTFNFSEYDVASEEIRMEFNYRMHGQPDSLEGNEVWVRGNDTDEWQHIYSYKSKSTDIGSIINSGTLSITDGLLNDSQKFSSSFQVKFGQRDSSLIASPSYGCGLTIDDIKFYTVQNDLQLTSIVTPNSIECGLNENSPLVVNLYNGVTRAQQNVIISYRLDDGDLVTESIANIDGKQKLQFTFKSNPNFAKPGKHVLVVWLNASGDTYHDNDSILNYTFYNQPLISTLPYNESFETNDGSWFSEGINSSWEWGAPASSKINRAGNGSKAWKTNLNGNYNDNEISYLYSPCFDLTNAVNPVLSFQASIDIESCGSVLCDGAYVEYSIDGIKWTHLGESRKGINWYNDTLYNIWSQQNNTNWHQASYTIPPTKSIVKLRFSFFSDIAGNFEGMGVDDVEIIDNRLYPEKQLISVSPNPTNNGQLTIEWTGNAQSKLNMVMTDIMGREVYRANINSAGNYNKSTIQTTRFAAGMYFMRINIDGEKYNYKILYN